VYVACYHLAPFKENAELRALELKYIVKAITAMDPAACVLIAGDMNMRENETDAVLQLGLGDAWLMSGSHPSVKFTWNSKVNQYLADCFGFTSALTACL
jgi:endonuclease/exonuclease/phosphatase family metal-dependent hydrolase